MRISSLMLISLVCMGMLTTAAAAVPTTQPSDLARENAELRRQLQQQKGEIARLQQRIRELERRQQQRFGMIVPPLNPLPPQLSPTPPRLLVTPPPPPGFHQNWVEKEFNGEKYYIVPLR